MVILQRCSSAHSQVVDRRLLKIGKDIGNRLNHFVHRKAVVWIAAPERPRAPGWKEPLDLLVIEARQGDLLEIVPALRPPRGFAGRLHRRQQQRIRMPMIVMTTNSSTSEKP